MYLIYVFIKSLSIIFSGNSEILKKLRVITDEENTVKLVCVDSKGRVGSPCGACREYLMQLDRDSKNIVILRNKDTYETIRLEELIPDWWGYDRV